MQSQDFKSLADAYSEMYAQKEEVLSEEVQLNEEEMLYDTILCHLLDEGFASTVEDAEKIMSVMTEGWVQSILEGAALDNSIKTLEGKRDAMNANKSGSANTAGPGKQSVGAATYQAYQRRLQGV